MNRTDYVNTLMECVNEAMKDMAEEKENCNFQQNYNVFGLEDKPCCYLYHKYCDEIDSCYFKKCKRLEQENKELRQQYNCYACDTCNGKEDYRNMKRHCENAIKTVHKYRSALEEIKKTVTNPYPGEPRDVLDIINGVLK